MKRAYFKSVISYFFLANVTTTHLDLMQAVDVALDLPTNVFFKTSQTSQEQEHSERQTMLVWCGVIMIIKETRRQLKEKWNTRENSERIAGDWISCKRGEICQDWSLHLLYIIMIVVEVRVLLKHVFDSDNIFILYILVRSSRLKKSTTRWEESWHTQNYIPNFCSYVNVIVKKEVKKVMCSSIK